MADWGLQSTNGHNLEGRSAFTLTMGGKSFRGALNIYMVGGTLTLQDTFTSTAGNANNIRLYNGTFDANDKNVTINGFHIVSTATDTKALYMGNGTWTMTTSVGGTTNGGWYIGTTTGLTFNAEGSTIKTSNLSSGKEYFTGGGLFYNNVVVQAHTQALRIVGDNTFASFTINGTRTIELTSGSIQTVNGTFTAIGNTASPITLNASTPASQAMLTLNGSAYVTNVAATDILGTGTAVTNYKGSVNNCVNWTVSATEVWVGKGADTNWATVSNWSSAVPIASVDVIFNNNYSNANCTIAAAAARSINFTGYTGTLTHNAGTTLSIGDASGGSLTFVAGMTYTRADNTSAVSFVSTTAGNTITTAGKSFGNVTFNGALGTTPPIAGDMPINLTTLWAWDTPLANWYFYAPSLDKSGGLSSYITSKGYLDFGSKVLEPTTGFWVNRP